MSFKAVSTPHEPNWKRRMKFSRLDVKVLSTDVKKNKGLLRVEQY